MDQYYQCVLCKIMYIHRNIKVKRNGSTTNVILYLAVNTVTYQHNT